MCVGGLDVLHAGQFHALICTCEQLKNYIEYHTIIKSNPHHIQGICTARNLNGTKPGSGVLSLDTNTFS